LTVTFWSVVIPPFINFTSSLFHFSSYPREHSCSFLFPIMGFPWLRISPLSISPFIFYMLTGGAFVQSSSLWGLFFVWEKCSILFFPTVFFSQRVSFFPPQSWTCSFYCALLTFPSPPQFFIGLIPHSCSYSFHYLFFLL